jgi:hypothetical protein
LSASQMNRPCVAIPCTSTHADLPSSASVIVGQ